jgi:esterase/lipase superfamily enzyme
MHIEEHHWHGHHLDRDMTLKGYGHWGSHLLSFPAPEAAISITKAWAW